MKVAIVSFYFNFPIYKRLDHPAFYCRTGYVVLLARRYYRGNCGFNRRQATQATTRTNNRDASDDDDDDTSNEDDDGNKRGNHDNEDGNTRSSYDNIDSNCRRQRQHLTLSMTMTLATMMATLLYN
jgi:hypothetical protein